MGDIKWKSERCPNGGILEIRGNLFLSLKCTTHCDDYRKKGECQVEKSFNVSGLNNESGYAALNSIYCFCEKLIDYGELKNFDGLCREYGLAKIEKDRVFYYDAERENWLRMLKTDRKLLFAVFANISGDISYQRWLIFKDLKNKWSELIDGDPDFYMDYREIKLLNPKLKVDKGNNWQGLCLRHPELYAYLTKDREYDFDDRELALLLAKHPDLDARAYEHLKLEAGRGRLEEKNGGGRKNMAPGDMWQTLLLGGVDGSRKKFWDDCAACGGFKSFGGRQWMSLFDDGKVGSRALEVFNSDEEYSHLLTDADWDAIASKTYYSRIAHRPDANNFVPFFRFAPRHAAKCQYKWLVVIAAAITVLGCIGMAALAGVLGRFSVLLCLTAGVIWSVILAKCFSYVAVRRNRNLVHGPLIGVSCGVLLPIMALLLYSICGQSAWGGVFFLFLYMSVFGGLFICAAAIAFFAPLEDNRARKADRSWLFYAIFSLMLAFGALIWIATSNRQLSESCRALDIRWRKHFLRRYLNEENYWQKWRTACEKGNADQFEEVLKKWKPEPNVFEKEYDAARKQLMDAVLAESVELENGKFGRLARTEKLVDDEAKKYLRGKLAAEESAKKIAAYLRIFKDHEIPMDDDLRRKLCAVATGQNDLAVSKKIWDQMDEEGKKLLGGKIADRIKKDFSQVKNDSDVKILTEIAKKHEKFDDKFWKSLLTKLVDGENELHFTVCNYLEQNLPKFVDLAKDSRKEFLDKVTRDETERFEEFIDSPGDLKKFGDFLHASKYLKKEEVGYVNDYWFWRGYIGRETKGDDPSDDWLNCFYAFLRPDKFKAANTRKYARDERCGFAKLLQDKHKERGRQLALRLWKACLEDRVRSEKQVRQAYRGIFDFEQDPDEFQKYFFEAARRHVDIWGLYANNLPPEVRNRIENVKPKTADEKTEIVRYYLAMRDYRRAREMFDEKEVFGRLDRLELNGETLYRLALIDPGLVSELKRRLSDGGLLSEIAKKFNAALDYACTPKGVPSKDYVQKARAKNHPEAMFITCVRNYYISNDASEDQLKFFESELRQCKDNLRKNHPDSEYIRYLDKLGKAAGISD